MYELIQTGTNSYYIDCPAKIGVYTADGQHVYLIDSGNDKDAGRKVRQILERNSWTLAGILNTHSHADHCGGNHYLQAQTGCPVFASGIESAFVRFPVLEPAFIYGGCPGKDLRHKFLMAQSSEAMDFSAADFDDARFPKEIEVIPLPGHCFHMTGFRTPDGTVFLADCISSKTTLEKYAVTFLYDVEAYLNTLDLVEKMQGSVFVPAHAEACEDIRPIVQYNRKKVLEIADLLLEFCKTPAPFEQILQQVFRHYNLRMNFEQHALVGSTIRSYLSWLKDSDKLDVEFQDCIMYWKRK